MYKERRDVSRFGAFGCRAWVHQTQVQLHLNPERIYLGFEPNSSAYSFFIPEKNTIMSSNQVQFDEGVRSERRRLLSSINMIIQQIYTAHQMSSGSPTLSCTSAIILTTQQLTTSDVMVMCVKTESNSYTRVTQQQWLQDKLD